jgi:hypothetical protein
VGSGSSCCWREAGSGSTCRGGVGFDKHFLLLLMQMALEVKGGKLYDPFSPEFSTGLPNASLGVL